MISVYAPSVVKHWGDWIVTLWIAELLKKNNEEIQIEFDDLHVQSQTREWIKFPWANRIVRKPLKLAQQQYDYVLATHHRHSFKRTLYPDLDGEKLLYFDAHGIVYKMVTENFYPTFVPSDRLEQEYNDLKLPERYDVVHLNDIDPIVDGRHDKPLAQYLKNSSFIDENKLTVSTSFHVPGTLNMSHVPAWLKLYVMIKSDSFWCSYTGFTSIASIYRHRNKSFIVNEAGPGVFNLGPPIISYSNYEVSNPGSINELYYAIDTDRIHDARGHAYLKRCEEIKRLWCQFETFDYVDFEKPNPNWARKHTYYDIENCAVPLDATYAKVDSKKQWNFMYDKEMMSLPIQGFRRR